ncbi:MAG TPA: hypothetical protein VK570_03350, partial [Rubrivivax sp.]|nr:hypothetical protein [Rubrivivax sp.]
MNGAGGRVRLAEVSDLISPGRPLPFRVLDGLGRLLLSAGHVVHDARQLASLLERGACVEYEEVAAVRKARAQGGSGVTHSVRKKSWFEKFDAQVLALDTLLRALGRDPDWACRSKARRRAPRVDRAPSRRRALPRCAPGRPPGLAVLGDA